MANKLKPNSFPQDPSTQTGSLGPAQRGRRMVTLNDNYEVHIFVSRFNSGHSIDTLLVDQWKNGICFKSNIAFLQGTPIVFRMNYRALNTACNSSLEKLPSIGLGEITFCRKLPGEASSSYEIGVKYYPPAY
jgi:hypothetical protein